VEDTFLEKSSDGQEKLQLRRSESCSSCHGDGKTALCKSSVTESPRMKTEREDHFPLPDLVKSTFEAEELQALLQHPKLNLRDELTAILMLACWLPLPQSRVHLSQLT